MDEKSYSDETRHWHIRLLLMPTVECSSTRESCQTSVCLSSVHPSVWLSHMREGCRVVMPRQRRWHSQCIYSIRNTSELLLNETVIFQSVTVFKNGKMACLCFLRQVAIEWQFPYKALNLIALQLVKRLISKKFTSSAIRSERSVIGDLRNRSAAASHVIWTWNFHHTASPHCRSKKTRVRLCSCAPDFLVTMRRVTSRALSSSSSRTNAASWNASV